MSITVSAPIMDNPAPSFKVGIYTLGNEAFSRHCNGCLASLPSAQHVDPACSWKGAGRSHVRLHMHTLIGLKSDSSGYLHTRPHHKDDTSCEVQHSFGLRS